MRQVPTIYFIRHGETDWNAERRYQGQRDIPLNDRGRAQARRNGEALKPLLPAIAGLRFISSPLSRTRETMHIVRETLGLEIAHYDVDDRIIELHYGDWQGRLQSDLPQLDPEGWEAREADPFHWRPKGGENYVDLSERLRSWAGSLEGACVVVSHGGVSRALRGMLVDGIVATDVPRLEVPQDRILVLSNRSLHWV
ncbi:MAG: histidine phosphatase family protein [Hyphomicrobiaceae bacterium]|nr:histidine phosphatase family protein [Hyphomicrobiaceae bacterium]